MVSLDDGTEPIGDQAAELPPIHGLLPSTLIDWPGRIASILFLPFCNLRCGYCHAGDLLEPAGDEVIPFAGIREHLESSRDWIDGVVVCGGEPTLHATLPNLCRALQDLGVGVKLDSNGTRPDVLAQLIASGLVDAVSMDLKTTLDARMVKLAGTDVDLEAIERSIDLLLDAAHLPAGDHTDGCQQRSHGTGDVGARPAWSEPSRGAGPEPSAAQAGLEVEFRTTCCPACVDREVVEWIARRIARGGPQTVAHAGAGNVSYVLQRFEPAHCLDPSYREIKPYSIGEMEALLEAARRIYPHTRLRGG